MLAEKTPKDYNRSRELANGRTSPTGKGKRWNQDRVATARRNHSIAGQKRALPDPDRVSLSEAARVLLDLYNGDGTVSEGGGERSGLNRRNKSPLRDGAFSVS